MRTYFSAKIWREMAGGHVLVARVFSKSYNVLF